MEKIKIYDANLDEMVEISLPYYRITYKDDEGKTHLATVTDKPYLDYLKNRFVIVDLEEVDE